MNMAFVRCSLVACLMPTAAFASETKLSGTEIEAALSDRSLYAGELGAIEQIFQKGGITFYIENGASSVGGWTVEENQYCSTWPPGRNKACYDVFGDGDAVIFVSKNGQRYPMRLTK
jgi:hypothetical protein